MYQCGYSTKHLAIKYKMYVGYKGKTNGKELSAKWVLSSHWYYGYFKLNSNVP